MAKAIFPGSFAPPTYGHLAIARRAASVFGSLTIICSRASDKSYVFTEEDCAQMWQGYDLPTNAEVITYAEAVASKITSSDMVMIRGIRSGDDYDYEGKVMQLNHERFGIKDYYYILADDDKIGISSSLARKSAAELDLIGLSQTVSPLVLTELLEQRLGLANLFLVVGRPGAGKSTLLGELCRKNTDCQWINTDDYSKVLAPLAAAHFGVDDIVRVALEQPGELSAVIGEQWLELLSKDLAKTQGVKHVFVEVAYGLAEDKQIYRYVGGKILHVGCDEETQRQRVLGRGTPELMPFFEVIPSLEESRSIASAKQLSIRELNTSEEDVALVARRFRDTLG